MKLISLNIYNGRCKAALSDYLRDNVADTDIFCFQETDGVLADEVLADVFGNSRGLSAIAYKETIHVFQLHTFVGRGHKIISSEILLDRDDGAGLALMCKVEVAGNIVYIVNVHGISQPGDKLDTSGRLRQSRVIIDYIRSIEEPVIICGDFNLLPQTKSIQEFTRHGYTDLIREYAIATTRNELVWRKHPDNRQLHADYMFLSPHIEAETFYVPNIEVSDHLPMELTCRHS